MKRPLALNIVGLFFFLGGLVGILTQTANLSFQIPSWSLLNMIAGLGLLKCWRGWRGYALFITWASLLFLVPSSIFAMLHPEQITVKFPSILIDQRDHAVLPRLLLALIFASYAGVAVWIVRTLHRRDVRALFQVRLA